MTTSTAPSAQELATLVHLATLTHLEGQIRVAKTIPELQFLSVNETRRLVPYDQAYLLSPASEASDAYRVICASSVAIVEREAPVIRWLEQMTHALRQEQSGDEAKILTEETCPESCREGWREYVHGHVLWCPLRHPDETVLGIWWFERESPWEDNDVAIVQRLAGSFAYAWKAVAQRSRTWSVRINTPSAWLLGAAIVSALCVPVRVSTIAPVKVTAKDPTIVSAPMDGVIAEVLVLPNTVVAQARPLFRYEDTNLRNQFQVAEKQLAVAEAEHAQAIQGGFADPQRKAEAPLKAAEAALKETELAYAREMLDQVEVRAPQAGLLLYTDKADWIGKPVAVGERIMEIADPRHIELRIDLPVSDALLLKEGADAVAFFDALPLESFAATVSRASYHAEVLPGDVLAYRVTAELATADPRIRIGWQGSAKVYGERGPLAFLLFRRPFTALRQLIGV